MQIEEIEIEMADDAIGGGVRAVARAPELFHLFTHRFGPFKSEVPADL